MILVMINLPYLRDLINNKENIHNPNTSIKVTNNQKKVHEQ
jgi:hypothetical protein